MNYSPSYTAVNPYMLPPMLGPNSRMPVPQAPRVVPQGALPQKPVTCPRCGTRVDCPRLKEGYDNVDQEEAGWEVPIWVKIASALIFALAAYLSWSCNVTEPLFLRVVYAGFAGIFGWVYLVYYFFVRSGFCKAV